MRLTQFQIVLLVGFMFLASSASAQKGHGGGKEGEHEGGGAANHAGRPAAHVESSRPATHVESSRPAARVESNRPAARVEASRPSGSTNGNMQRRAGSFSATPQHQSGNVGRNDVRANSRANINGSRGNIAGPNAWRYRQQNNQWWYWMPNNSWVYWNNGTWLPYGAYAGSGYNNGAYTSGYRGTNSLGGGYLGVSFDPQSTNAAVISQVNANSPAQSAGLQRGDVIRAVNGQEIRSAYEPSNMIRQYAPGAEVTLSIERNQQVTDVAVVLAQL